VKPERKKPLYFDFHEEDKELLDLLEDSNVKEGKSSKIKLIFRRSCGNK
jgi:hypothetical protein